MAAETPPFWWQKPGLFSAALWPASAAYAAYMRRRIRTQGSIAVDVPILCIASLAVGAAGKTPVAVAIAAHASAIGMRPGFVSRGPSTLHSEAHLVAPRRDSARHVGVEALELARHAPVAVSNRREAAARMLAGEGCDLIILLDDFLGARLAIDHVTAVVEAARGLGNGRVIPAGPLRAPLVDQLRHVQSLVVLGEGDAADRAVRHVARAGRPIHVARERPIAGGLQGQRFLAFSSVGAPGHFHAMIREAGGEVVSARSFAPGHQYTQEQATDLAGLAQAEQLELVTTMRDAIGLGQAATPVKALIGKAQVLPIEVAFESTQSAGRIIAETVGAWQQRHLRPG